MKKKKVGFWQRIRNIYNDSPWHAAFTYPIAYIFLWTLVVAILVALKAPEIIGITFMIAIFIAPIWVLIGLIIAKKRIPYLLSLIIGLGFPIFVANFAFKGFTKTAQQSATRTIHLQTVKYISANLQACKIGEITAMDGDLTCSNYTATKAIWVTVVKMKDINPYKSADLAVRLSSNNTNDEDVGYISLSASGSNIIIKSCNKTPCNEEANRQSSTISIK